LDDEIDFGLRDTCGVSVVFLKENHLDTAIVREEVNCDPILPDLRIAFLQRGIQVTSVPEPMRLVYVNRAYTQIPQ
jgi:hypothetical protein